MCLSRLPGWTDLRVGRLEARCEEGLQCVELGTKEVQGSIVGRGAGATLGVAFLLAFPVVVRREKGMRKEQ